MQINDKKLRLSLITAFITTLVSLTSILRTGLYTDDLFYFQERNGISTYRNQSVVEITKPLVAGWKWGGRFAPFSLYLQTIIFKIFTSVISYKLYLVVINILAVLSFLFFLWAIDLPQIMPLFLLFFAAEIQFRLQYHDVFTAIHGMYQVLAIFMFTSLSCYVYALKKNSAGAFFVALVLAACALLTSEVGICLGPLLFVITWYPPASLKRKIVALIPVVILFSVYMVYILHLRKTGNVFYAGLQTNYTAEAVWHVLAVQLFASLPLSDLYKQAAVFQILAAQLRHTGVVIILTITLSASLLSLRLLKFNQHTNRFQFISILFVWGLLLFILPALIISSSIKYQEELYFGSAYLPVFIQDFGLAFCLAYLSYWLLGYKTVFSRIAFSTLALYAVMGITSAILFNSALTTVRNYQTSIPGMVLYNNIKSGILSGCEPRSTIILANDYYWHGANQYQKIINDTYNRNFTVLDSSDRTMKNDTLNCYLLSCNTGDTIFTSLYKYNNATGRLVGLVKCDTGYHCWRIKSIEASVLEIRR